MSFWDASALVPLIIEQSLTKRAQSLFKDENGNAIVWWGSIAECTSAISRLEREEALSLDEADRAFVFLKRLAKNWNEVEPVSLVRERAVRLLRLHPLRTADAFQLAAALIASEDLQSPLRFVCFDERLASAARREGFEVEGP